MKVVERFTEVNMASSALLSYLLYSWDAYCASLEKMILTSELVDSLETYCMVPLGAASLQYLYPFHLGWFASRKGKSRTGKGTP